MLADLGMAAAGLLAVTFAWAGAAKLSRPGETAAGFGELGLGHAAGWGRVVPVVELALGVGLLAVPAAGGAAALALLGAFSAVLVRALRRGVEVRCACFGRAGGPALSWLELVRNGVLGALALLAVAAGPTPRLPALVPTAAVLVVVASATCLLALLRRRRA